MCTERWQSRHARLDYDLWKCTPPDEPTATPADMWHVVVAIAERDNTLVMHPVLVDDDGASVWAANVSDDGEDVWSSGEVFATWDDVEVSDG